jgi:hypothetical protein
MQGACADHHIEGIVPEAQPVGIALLEIKLRE